MAEGEFGASVHLPLDYLGPGVDSFGAAVVMRQRECHRSGHGMSKSRPRTQAWT